MPAFMDHHCISPRLLRRWNISQQITFIDVDLQTETRFSLSNYPVALFAILVAEETLYIPLDRFRRKIPARLDREATIFTV